MTVREPLRGVIPPVITPLTPSGDVDVTSLQRLVNFEVGAGVHAIFVLGTGGEGPYLTEDQQRITLDTVTKTGLIREVRGFVGRAATRRGGNRWRS
jgi:4-hydroxy-tetrahydrodipicolinate synthase